MPLRGFWIRCDAVKCEAFGVPEHKIEEHISRKFRIVHFDMTAGGRLTQNTCNSPDRTQPAFFHCQCCQLRKLHSLSRKNPMQRACLRRQRVCKHMSAKLMQSRLDAFGGGLDCLGFSCRRYRSKPPSYPAPQHSREEIPLVMVARIDGWLAHASRLRDRVNGCAVKASFHEQSRCDVEQPHVTRLSIFPSGTAPWIDVRKLRHGFLLADDEFFYDVPLFSEA